MIIIYWILLLYARTWRIQIDPALQNRIKEGLPMAFWHGVLGILACLFPSGNVIAIVSSSKDGDWLAGFLRHRQFRLIRGSAHQNGSYVREKALEEAAKGQAVLYAVDGSRGPPGIPKRGVFSLAQKMQVPLCFVAVHCDRYWQLSSWDAFVIPKPFARVRLQIHQLDCPAEIEASQSRMMTSHRSSLFPLAD